MPTSGYVNPYDTARSNYSDIFHPKPSTSTTTGSTGSLPGQTSAPDLTSITELVNNLNRQGQAAANEARVPGSGAVEQQLLGNTSQLAQGQLPADVIQQIQQQSAERGVSTGNNDYLRALGLDSLQAQQQAQQNLTAADARNPVAPLFNPASQLLTPAQSSEIGYQNSLLALDWWRALHGGVGGGGGGSAATAPPSQPTQSTDWFNTLMGGTPSSSSVTPPPSGDNFPTTTSTTVPGAGTSVYTGQDWSNLFGNPYDTSGTSGGAPIGTVDTGSASTYDPFAQYGDYLSSGG